MISTIDDCLWLTVDNINMSKIPETIQQREENDIPRYPWNYLTTRRCVWKWTDCRISETVIRIDWLSTSQQQGFFDWWHQNHDWLLTSQQQGFCYKWRAISIWARRSPENIQWGWFSTHTSQQQGSHKWRAISFQRISDIPKNSNSYNSFS